MSEETNDILLVEELPVEEAVLEAVETAIAEEVSVDVIESDIPKGVVECEKHGLSSNIVFSYDETTLFTGCFKCYVEKATEGLHNFV